MANRKGINGREVPGSALAEPNLYGSDGKKSKRGGKRHRRSKNTAAGADDALTRTLVKQVEHSITANGTKASSAVTPQSKVFGTHELLVHILDHIEDILDLVTCQRVSSVWYNIITTSPQLQRSLFFKSLPTSDKDPMWNPVTAYVLKSLATTLYGGFLSWAFTYPNKVGQTSSRNLGVLFTFAEISWFEPNYISFRLPNAVLPQTPWEVYVRSRKVPNGQTMDYFHIKVAELDLWTFRIEAPAKNEGSWRKMYLTNPPSVIKVSENLRGEQQSEGSFEAWTLGELVDKFIEFSGEALYLPRVIAKRHTRFA